MPDYKEILIRKPYDIPDRVQLSFNFDKDENPIEYKKSLSMTQQQFKDECDVNVIISRYQTTGLLPESDKEPVYGDVSDLPTFQQAQAILIEATDRFNQLPSIVRARFDHNPANFLAFMDDPNNLLEAEKLGLVKINKDSDVFIADKIDQSVQKGPITDFVGSKEDNKPSVVASEKTDT